MSALHKLDEDFESYHTYNRDDKYGLKDAKCIVVQVPGYADGDSWHWIVALKDGTFAYTTAWCDYTGWD
jgi:hypothetical protein